MNSSFTNNDGPNLAENEALSVRIAPCVDGVDADAHEEHQCQEDGHADDVVVQDPDETLSPYYN